MKQHVKQTLDILERLDEERGKAVLAFAESIEQKEIQRQKRLTKFSHIPKWADRKSGREVTPVDFIKTHYGKINEDSSWDSDGLTGGQLKENDELLYSNYYRTIRKYPEQDLGIPIRQRSKSPDPEKLMEQQRASKKAYYHRNKGR